LEQLDHLIDLSEGFDSIVQSFDIHSNSLNSFCRIDIGDFMLKYSRAFQEFTQKQNDSLLLINNLFNDLKNFKQTIQENQQKITELNDNINSINLSNSDTSIKLSEIIDIIDSSNKEKVNMELQYENFKLSFSNLQIIKLRTDCSYETGIITTNYLRTIICRFENIIDDLILIVEYENSDKLISGITLTENIIPTDFDNFKNYENPIVLYNSHTKKKNPNSEPQIKAGKNNTEFEIEFYYKKKDLNCIIITGLNTLKHQNLKLVSYFLNQKS